jgi:hypothetical protein
MVSKLRVGPHNREPNVWNRQLLMMRRLQHLFPCLQEIDFDQVCHKRTSTALHYRIQHVSTQILGENRPCCNPPAWTWR